MVPGKLGGRIATTATTIITTTSTTTTTTAMITTIATIITTPATSVHLWGLLLSKEAAVFDSGYRLPHNDLWL